MILVKEKCKFKLFNELTVKIRIKDTLKERRRLNKT